MSLITPYDSSDYPNFSTTAFPNGVLTSGKLALQVAYLLSSAELKALQTTAILLAATPGAGFMLDPRAMLLQYKFLTTAYTIANADNNFQIEHVGKTTNLMKTVATGLVDQVVNEIVNVPPATPAIITQTNRENLGLELKLVGTTPALTLGLGSVLVVLAYDVVKLQ